jgi:hypothetical protein
MLISRFYCSVIKCPLSKNIGVYTIIYLKKVDYNNILNFFYKAVQLITINLMSVHIFKMIICWNDLGRGSGTA